MILWADTFLTHPLGVCPSLPHVEHLRCLGYNFWSGVEGALPQLAALGILVTAIIRVRSFLHHHFECHNETCSKLGFHHVQGTPYRTCWSHHPVLGHHVHHGVPLHHIHQSHKEALTGAIKVKDGNS